MSCDTYTQNGLLRDEVRVLRARNDLQRFIAAHAQPLRPCDGPDDAQWVSEQRQQLACADDALRDLVRLAMRQSRALATLAWYVTQFQDDMGEDMYRELCRAFDHYVPGFLMEFAALLRGEASED